MSITRRRILQGAAAAAGLLSIPAIVTRAFAEGRRRRRCAAACRGNTTGPGFSRSWTRPTLFVSAFGRIERAGVCLEVEDDPIRGPLRTQVPDFTTTVMAAPESP